MLDVTARHFMSSGIKKANSTVPAFRVRHSSVIKKLSIFNTNSLKQKGKGG